MFDLDKAIGDWRQGMMAGGIISSDILTELESHLREDVEERVRSGIAEEQAFGLAVKQLGQPSTLQHEFKQAGTERRARIRGRDAFLVLAGIPEGDTNMNTPMNLEPRWATYTKAMAFLLPALFLWALSAVFVWPKVQQIWVTGNPTTALPPAVALMIELTHNGWFICGALLVTLLLLEWRVSAWPRYRRAAVGVATFLVNALVLIAIFMMVVTAVLAAPALLHHAR